MSDEINSFEEDDVYAFKKYGSFGRFLSNGSLPVDYVLTTFVPEELSSYLTFARDINPGQQLDFDLLMQRDIDDERVKKKIEPYLNPRENSAEKMAETVLFFPPLLAALVPVENREMVKYYNSPEVGEDGNQKTLSIKYVNQFIIDFPLGGSGLNRYTLKFPALGSGANAYDVDKRQVRLSMKLALKAGRGVKLVVIDGQHRLKALIDVYDKQPSVLRDLVIPVCILFSPDSNDKVVSSSLNNIPHIPEVFRKLFVDVNHKAEQVGGHFNILLSDARLRSLVTRGLCSHVLASSSGEEKLAAIEWNVKSLKDSTQIKKKYSIASVGVIDLSLLDMFGQYGVRGARSSIIEYWFGTSRFPELMVDEEGDDVALNWDELSLKQRSLLKDAVSEEVVADIYKIYFDIEQFKIAFNIFHEEIERYRKLSTDHGDGLDYSAALDYLIKYKNTSNGDAKKKIESFEKLVSDRRQSLCADIIKYSIFHRSIFDLLGHLLIIGSRYSFSPRSMVDATIHVVNEALKDRGVLLDFSNPYMHHSVFQPDGKIYPTVTTKVALSRLMFAVAGKRSISNEICKIVGVAGTESGDKFREELELSAITAAHKFLSIYEAQRKKSFVKTYPGDYGLPTDTRAELASAQDEQKSDMRKVKNKIIKKEDVSTKFDNLVAKYVKEDVANAYVDLRAALGYNQEILQYLESDDELDE